MVEDNEMPQQPVDLRRKSDDRSPPPEPPAKAARSEDPAGPSLQAEPPFKAAWVEEPQELSDLFLHSSRGSYSVVKQPQVQQLVGSDALLDHAIDSAHECLLAAELDLHGCVPWTAKESFLVVPGPWRHSRCFYYDPKDDECFSVSSDDILTPDDIAKHWAAVNQADREEVASFTAHEVFSLERKTPEVDNVVDGVWVRRWKNKEKGIIRSRCCGRGFLDRQKTTIWPPQQHSIQAVPQAALLSCHAA